MKRMICEVCGSHDFRKGDDELFVCEFCQTKYTPQQAKKLLVEGVVKIDKSDDIDKYLAMAEHSLENDNFEEAYSYANKILEVNHEDSNGWLLKGLAAGSLTTIESPRISEMLKAFQLSLEYSNENSIKEIKKRMIGSSFAISEWLWGITIETVKEMSRNSDLYDVDTWDFGLWEACLLSQEEIKAGLGFVVENAEPLENDEGTDQRLTALNAIVVLSDAILEGLSNMPDERGPIGASMNQQRKSLKEYLELQKNEAIEAAKKINPEVKLDDNSTCFVATATMGSEYSATVVVLREFRDQILRKSRYGRSFVKWYYAKGPYLASLVRKSDVFRMTSLLMVVLPAAMVAWICLSISKSIKGVENY